jgi:hypothetical protein
MTSSQRIHLQELFNRKHLAVIEAWQKSGAAGVPDFSKRNFLNFLIEKYENFISVPRGTIK